VTRTAPGILALLCLLTIAPSAHAEDTPRVDFPANWFALAPEEAGLVFMLRSHGGDTGFDLVDETGRVVDALTLPRERTVLAQYRVPAGSYVLRFFDREAKVKATPGFFAAFGGAVTHRAPDAEQVAPIVPDYAPFANYTPAAMEGRVTPLAALGTTNFLPPKRLDATTLELRLTDEN
jgi:hypothetical protein